MFITTSFLGKKGYYYTGYSVFTYRIYNKQSLKPFQHIMSIAKHVCPVNEQHSTLLFVVKS